ncbi:GNAT family N-acetyltransferase [Jannaschia marina]|uniref:GNAT family N-acetyltransferase n=1 Tax=Jannaschia marina TaxID=2741674 RepID=UPI0015CB92CA|nr:GNAT family N-acetyltransferase [Jannaschia marina]
MNIQTFPDRPPSDPVAFARWVDARFAAEPARGQLELSAEQLAVAARNGLPRYVTRQAGGATIRKAGFLQAPDAWLRHPQTPRPGAADVAGPEGRDHPLRPANPEGLVYERHFADAGVTVAFWSVEVDRDLDMFHRWQNDPRVAYFWEEDKSKEELRAFLETRQADPHNFSVIGTYDGEPVGYFEIYWAREDRLGAHYDAGAWDRGWHGLIGETAQLGRRKTSAWIRALTHYIFLDCPMTEVVVGEPRVDNAKLLRYADAMAYEKVKEFDFPHKRSALMRCRRSAFFDRVPM